MPGAYAGQPDAPAAAAPTAQPAAAPDPVEVAARQARHIAARRAGVVLGIAPGERWCRCCGESAGADGYCVRCGDECARCDGHYTVPAVAVLWPAEYRQPVAQLQPA